MIEFSIFLFIMAALFIIIGILIYMGKTDLIHDYHQKKVTDKIGYGKSFGKAVLLLGLFLVLSGVIALFGDSDTIALSAVGVLIIGVIISIVLFIRIQKKYNGGVF